MYKEINKLIKKYNSIVIARHVGVDPDALCSQLALRDSIKLTFPEKKVIAVGSGSHKFKSIGNIDKYEVLDNVRTIYQFNERMHCECIRNKYRPNLY